MAHRYSYQVIMIKSLSFSILLHKLGSTAMLALRYPIHDDDDAISVAAPPALARSAVDERITLDIRLGPP